MSHTDEEGTSFTQRVVDNLNGFRNFLWNSEEKTVLGRGAKSWAKISLFYLVFYSCLAGFWAALLQIFLQTISYDRPKWTALISTPALSILPIPNEDNRIRWTPTDPESYERITREIRDLLRGIQERNDDDLEDCTTGGAGTLAEGQRFCGFDVNLLGPCQHEPYGWDTLKPCVFIRLNRVYGWIPENYDNPDPEDFPDGVTELGLPVENNIGIACLPRRGSEVNATMPFPPAGIPFGFFPYALGTNSEERQRLIQPVVAVQISLLKANEPVNLECQAYTGNISPRGGLFDTDEEARFRFRLEARTED